MRRPAVIVALLLALILGGGGLVAWIGHHHKSQGGDVRLVAAATADKPAGDTTKLALPESTPMALLRSESDTSQSSPKICLIFTKPVAPNLNWGEYLRLEPAAKPDVVVSNERICLSGLQFGVEYKVKLAAGLPAASGEKLPAPEETSISLGDHQASIQFPGSGFILPREGTVGLPIETVNVTRLKIKVLRIGDRILASELRQNFNRELYHYAVKQLQDEKAALVWSGNLDVQSQHNQRTTTVFPLAETLKERKPGAYLIIAENGRARGASGDDGDEDGENWGAVAGQWVIDTDIALTTMKGTDGLHVFARSLSTAKPLANVAVNLIANGNDELSKATTDAEGQVLFAPGLLRGTGGMAPSALMAYGPGGDFAVLDLRRPAFDLSDRGVSGTEQPGPVDAFLYPDRGIYRPGETLRLSVLLRDRLANAVENTSATIVITRPNGSEYRRFKAEPQGVGALTQDVELPVTASRGMWHAMAYLDPTGKAIGSLDFEVQDFVPQRLKVIATSPAKYLSLGDRLQVDLDGVFLYGAPAADLEAEVEAKLVPDPTPFTDLKDYHFGLADDAFKEQVLKLDAPHTDAKGKAVAVAEVGQLPKTTLPLKAMISAGLVEPGGRLTRTLLSLPVVSGDLLLGLRPHFDGGRVEEGRPASFDLLAVDAEGKSKPAKGLHYTFIEELVDYHWYSEYGHWRFETVVRDRVLDTGALDLDGGKPLTLSRRVDWGRYRLLVEDPQSGAATSYRFRAGWSATAENDSPDKVEVSVEKAAYKPGETARIAIRTAVGGQAMVAVASDRLFQARNLAVPAGGSVLEVPVSADWGSGAYVMVEVYRPLDKGRQHDPARSIGLVWVGVDPADRLLTIDLGAPEKAKPRAKLDLPVKVGGAGGESAFLTVSAVDEGILQLTRFATPDPLAHYFGKRRLGVDVRDDYGRLLDPGEGEAGKIRSGGDGMGGKGLPVVPTKTVALFSGVVKLAGDGTAHIPIDVPDFNGELRLMAVAHSKTRIGKADAHVTVRDPVVAEVSLPRFLQPGDNGRMTLLVHNVDGPAGDYKLTLAASGAVALDGSGDLSYALGQNDRKIESLPIKGVSSGIGKVSLALTGPDGFHVERDWSIAVRSPFLPLSQEQLAQQGAGEDYRLDPALLTGFEPGSVKVSVNYSQHAGIDVPGLLQSLDRYPFGCSEQLTSRAMPLLAFDDPALIAVGDVEPKPVFRAKVQEVINSLLERQGTDGTFGLYHADDDWGSAWLDVYVTDFLAQARTRGYGVPDFAFRRSLGRVGHVARGEGGSGNNWLGSPSDARAYAHYLMAREGQGDLGDLRAYYDEHLHSQSPFWLAEVGTAFAFMGDQARSSAAFAEVEKHVGWLEPHNDYQTPLRDLAGAIAFAAEAKQPGVETNLLARLGQFERIPSRLNTQEKGWLLRAASAMASGDPILLAVNGQAADASTAGPRSFHPTVAQVEAGFTVTNRAPGSVWRSVAVTGTPLLAPPAQSAGVEIAKTLLTFEGTPVDPATIRQNDRFIVHLKGRVLDHNYHQLALVDLLPAGWEIQALVLPDVKGKTPYAFLGAMSSPMTREARDDRYVASVELQGGRDGYYDRDEADIPKPDEFNLAYIVRAVTPGDFTLPGVVVDDMYLPQLTARTDSGHTTIAPSR